MRVIKILGNLNQDKPYLFNRVMDIQKSAKVAGKYIQPFGDVILKPHSTDTWYKLRLNLANEGIKWLETDDE